MDIVAIPWVSQIPRFTHHQVCVDVEGLTPEGIGHSYSRAPGLNQLIDFRGWHGAAQQISLKIHFAHIHEGRDGADMLDAFRDDPFAQGPSHENNGLDDWKHSRLIIHGSDEAMVQLDGVDGELVQEAEARLFGSEVIE